MRALNTLLWIILSSIASVEARGTPVIGGRTAATDVIDVRTPGTDVIDVRAAGTDQIDVRTPGTDVIALRRVGSERTGERPDDRLCASWIDRQHIRLHYAESGENAIQGWPQTAVRDSLAAWLERAWRCCRDTLGLPAPLGDRGRGGGTDLVDCYVRAIGPGYSGYTLRDSCASTAACEDVCAAYIEISNNPALVASLRDVASHEVFHVFQIGLSSGQDSWFMESTAVWAERRMWPQDATHDASIAAWFATPYLSLWDETSDREYGAAHFWRFLDQTERTAVAPEIWRRCCGSQWRAAMDQWLAERGETFDQVLYKFALWNDATGGRDDGRHYADGARLPEVSCQAIHQTYPVLEAELPDSRLARAAGNDYIRFAGPGVRDTLQILFDGDYAVRGMRIVSFVAETAPDSAREWSISPDENGDVSFALPGWSRATDLTMIVSNGPEAGTNLGFRYSAWEGGPTPIRPFGPLRIFPNPFSQSTTIRCTAPAGQQPAELSIFDPAGRSVRRFSPGPSARMIFP